MKYLHLLFLIFSIDIAMARSVENLDLADCQKIQASTMDARNLKNIQVAELGFYTIPDFLPDTLMPVWNATWRLQLLSACQGSGSMFMVKKDEKAAYFLTNLHVVEGQNHSFTPKDCVRGGYMQSDRDQVQLSGIIDDVIMKPKRSSNNVDLALVKVDLTAPGAEPLRKINPVILPKSCAGLDEIKKNPEGSRLFSIGYPGFYLRNPYFGINSLHERRWSRGKFVNMDPMSFRVDAKDLGYDPNSLAFSQVDSLPGSSGGPIYSNEGVFVGVLAMTAVGETKRVQIPEKLNLGYTQIDQIIPSAAKNYTGHVSCESVLKFLEGTPVRPTVKAK